MEEILIPDVISQILLFLDNSQKAKLSLVCKSNRVLVWSLTSEFRPKNRTFPYTDFVVRCTGAQLQTLILKGSVKNYTALFSHLATNCPNLTVLSLPSNALYVTRAFLHLGKVISRLSSLTVRACRQMENDYLIHSFCIILHFVEEPARRLKHLNLSFAPQRQLDFDFFKATMSSFASSLVSIHFPLLLKLSVLPELFSGFSSLEEISGLQLLGYCPPEYNLKLATECFGGLASTKVGYNLYSTCPRPLLQFFCCRLAVPLQQIVKALESVGATAQMPPQFIASVLNELCEEEFDFMIVPMCNFLATSDSSLLPSPDTISPLVQENFFHHVMENFTVAAIQSICSLLSPRPTQHDYLVSAWLRRDTYTPELITILEKSGCCHQGKLTHPPETNLFMDVRLDEALHWLLNSLSLQESIRMLKDNVIDDWISEGWFHFVATAVSFVNDESLLAFPNNKKLTEVLSTAEIDFKLCKRIVEATGLENIGGHCRGYLLSHYLCDFEEFTDSADIFEYFSKLFDDDYQHGRGIEPHFFCNSGTSSNLWSGIDNRDNFRIIINFLRTFRTPLMRQIDSEEILRQMWASISTLFVDTFRAVRGASTDIHDKVYGDAIVYLMREFFVPLTFMFPRFRSSACLNLIEHLADLISESTLDLAKAIMQFCISADLRLPGASISAEISDAVIHLLLKGVTKLEASVLEPCFELIQPQHFNRMHQCCSSPLRRGNLLDYLCLRTVASKFINLKRIIDQLVRRGARMSVVFSRFPNLDTKECCRLFYPPAIDMYAEIIDTLAVPIE